MSQNKNEAATASEGKQKFTVLWTGGWDSTFRIVELSQENVCIQPVYVIDPNRTSVELEKKSMNDTLAALKLRPETKAEFMPIQMYRLEDIPRDEEISKAYRTIHSVTHLGSQYEWLAWLGKLHPNMEVGATAAAPEISGVNNSFRQFCALEIVDGIGRINHEKSSQEGNLVLGWFTFPLITRTEIDMLQMVKEWHYEDVMEHIWFCHHPVEGKPCGICHPCIIKMESGMEWLLPPQAQRNYKSFNLAKKVFGPSIARKFARFRRRIQERSLR